MATSNLLNTHFDESEEEDDNFNPQPADLSDTEEAGGPDDDDADNQIRGEAAGRRVQDGSEDESARPSTNGKKKSLSDADDEDVEGEGEDTAPRDDDDEEDDEDEDEDEEEVTVGLYESSFTPLDLSLCYFT